jgi:drug/metabolite transporter (DMT)-like permease
LIVLTRTLLLFTVVVWGWTFVATKICLEFVTPVELLALRLLVGVPALAVVMLFQKQRLEFSARDRSRLLLGSVVITVHFLVQITGLNYTSATNTGWIIAVTPLVIVLLSFLFLKEQIGRNQVAGILLATVGILLLVSKGKFSNLGWLGSVGDWLVLASAHTWALYTVVMRDLSRTRNPLAVTLGILLPGMVVMVGYVGLTSDLSTFVNLPLRPVLALLFLGIFGTALGQWFWQFGVARIGAAQSGTFLYIEPFATTVLAVPLLNEPFGILTALGGLFVLAGVFWAQQQT